MWKSEQDQQEDYQAIAEQALIACDDWEKRYWEVAGMADELVEVVDLLTKGK